MDKVISLMLLLLVMAGVFWLLYWNGYMVINSKSAVSFIGSGRGNRAVFTACNGSIRRIVRFRADGTCVFRLKTELSKGEVCVELLDSGRQRIVLLDSGNPGAVVPVSKGKRYDLVIRFRSATGRYVLNYEMS